MSRHRTMLADQRGFTMITVVVSMMVIGLFAVGAYAAAMGDIPVARADQDRKRAYEAAEAGIEWYSFQLAKNSNYWTNCTDVGAGMPVVNAWNGSGADTRTGHYRTIPGTGDTPATSEQYVVELMPANPAVPCSETAPQKTMLDGGNLKIRATGIANGKKRQIVATFRRDGFLQFIYFTDRETQAPVSYNGGASSHDESWAQDNCDLPRSQRDADCVDITFVDNDNIKGPFHTNDDSVMVCGTPTFGRDSEDKVEIVGKAPASKASVFVPSARCSESENIQGTLNPGAANLDLPSTNSQLTALADTKFTGNTCLQFMADDTINAYTNLMCQGTPSSLPASDRVIYVANGAGGCTAGYQFAQLYNSSVSCGDVVVMGNYTNYSTTVAAANDVIVGNNLSRPDNGTGMVGLIADNFVRVYHPARTSSGSCISSNQRPTYPAPFGAPTTVDAAILALNQSWIVDNFNCGAHVGDLNVLGAIAQKWRGPVGQGDAGYTKQYVYDDRLRYESPPQFLDPTQASWGLLRRQEQSPAS